MECTEVLLSMSCKLGLVAVMWVVSECSHIFMYHHIVIMGPPSYREGSVGSEKQSCTLKVTSPNMFSVLNEWISIELGLKANVL